MLRHMATSGWRRDSLMLAGALLLLTLLQLIHSQWLDLAYLRQAILQGAWWRLFTGGLVHSNDLHLLMNLLGLLLLSWIYRPYCNIPRQLACLLLLVPLIDLAILWLDPSLQRYVGLSGALHGLFCYGALLSLRAGDRQQIWWLLGLLVKLLWDHWHRDGLTAELIGVPVYDGAHWLGALFGLLLAGGQWLRRGSSSH
ncbi:rhombosortase [Pseudaeromonas sp. ZJS20]|uniref:rhombosortase n=1 Tax=Pseudaeromonas aegiceratis TaxID=3153928 RepID=UPI00390C90C2